MAKQRRIDAFLVAPPGKRARAGAAADAAGDAAPPAAAAASSSAEAAARNAAAARAVVARAEAAGAPPPLADLLVEPSWRDALAPEFAAPYWRDLERFVHGEWASRAPVFPPKASVFRALNACPLADVRVLIVGQDPYHGLGQAEGLAFSVRPGVAAPPSLKNIFKEVESDLACPPRARAATSLEPWARQGVLLLNAVLTVRAGAAASHAKRGWERFTDAAIAALSQQTRGVVFMLWGRYAQDKGRVIAPGRGHHVLQAHHPSPLSAHRGFFGCRHFSRANALLAADGRPPVDWCLEE